LHPVIARAQDHNAAWVTTIVIQAAFLLAIGDSASCCKNSFAVLDEQDGESSW